MARKTKAALARDKAINGVFSRAFDCIPVDMMAIPAIYREIGALLDEAERLALLGGGNFPDNVRAFVEAGILPIVARYRKDGKGEAPGISVTMV